MWHAARAEDHAAWADVELLVPDPEDVLALEHVEELVLVLVDVKRRVERLDLLDDRERAPGRVRGRPDQELGVAEAEALAVIPVEPVSAEPPRHGADSSPRENARGA
jgi:hypothetical protein